MASKYLGSSSDHLALDERISQHLSEDAYPASRRGRRWSVPGLGCCMKACPGLSAQGSKAVLQSLQPGLRRLTGVPETLEDYLSPLQEAHGSSAPSQMRKWAGVGLVKGGGWFGLDQASFSLSF